MFIVIFQPNIDLSFGGWADDLSGLSYYDYDVYELGHNGVDLIDGMSVVISQTKIHVDNRAVIPNRVSLSSEVVHIPMILFICIMVKRNIAMYSKVYLRIGKLCVKLRNGLHVCFDYLFLDHINCS